jgi:leucyl/phenylalanyl-tRNA--protein transferase
MFSSDFLAICPQVCLLQLFPLPPAVVFSTRFTYRTVMFRLRPHDLRFPPVNQATPEGLLAVGGDLRPKRILAAYRHGIFPWYNEGDPILWWSPDPRAVLFPNKLHVARSLKKTLRSNVFTVTLDTCFRQVMEQCAGPRPQYPEGGTWITDDMRDAYTRLHELGYAHSVESWQEGILVGGLYGIAIGGAFFAESMFTRVDDASKVALVKLVQQLQAWNFRLIDCQQSSPHVMRFGAEEILRSDFINQLIEALRIPDRRGRWVFDEVSDTGRSEKSG